MTITPWDTARQLVDAIIELEGINDQLTRLQNEKLRAQELRNDCEKELLKRTGPNAPVKAFEVDGVAVIVTYEKGVVCYTIENQHLDNPNAF